MILHIINDTTLQDVQSSFSKTFPYLKIEFIPAKLEVEGKIECHPGVPLKEIQKKKLFPNLLQVQPWYKCADVENLFSTMFGLSIKLFRRHEASWIEASKDLPVEELNKIARHSAEYYFHMKREKQVHIW
jgi:hypothetical protein